MIGTSNHVHFVRPIGCSRAMPVAVPAVLKRDIIVCRKFLSFVRSGHLVLVILELNTLLY